MPHTSHSWMESNQYLGFLSNLIHFQHPRMCPDFHQILIICENTRSPQRHSSKVSNIGRQSTEILLIQFYLYFWQPDTDDILMFWWQKLGQCRVIFSLNRTIQQIKTTISQNLTAVCCNWDNWDCLSQPFKNTSFFLTKSPTQLCHC